MLRQGGSLLRRPFSKLIVKLWNLLVFCSSVPFFWFLKITHFRMESPSAEMSNEQIATIVERALTIADLDQSPMEFLDGNADDETIEDDHAVPVTTAHAVHVHENHGAPAARANVLANSPLLVHHNEITPDIVPQIENALDFDDRIALVFLLYDNEDLALQRIKVAKQSDSISLIADWARLEARHNPQWRDKLLEALCIIQNYKIIRELGCFQDEVDLRFLPNNPDTSVYVNITRKILYRLCEALDTEQTKKLLQYIKSDMIKWGRAPNDFWTFDPDLMEVAFLHMMSLRFLNIGVNCTNCDVSGLVRGLKAIGAFELVEDFELLQSNWPGNCEDIAPAASDISSLTSSVTGHVVKAEESANPPDNGNEFLYPINLKHVGLCAIINQKTFTRDPNPSLKNLLPGEHLATRVGTDLDRDRLVEIFTNLGFTVTIKENLTHGEMVDFVQKCGSKLVHNYHSSFALCILSHGIQNVVYGSNSVPVYVDNIEKILHGPQCHNLFGKPKMLIIQACQGTARQTARESEHIETDGPVCTKSSPEIGDMITFWSTIPGYVSFRDKVHGSWFIKSLWCEMMSSGAKDINKVFIRVNGRVSDRQAILDGERNAMMPIYNTTLRRELIFPQHVKFRAEASRKIVERVMFNKLINEFAGYYLSKRAR